MSNREIMAIVTGTITGVFVLFALVLFLTKLKRAKHSKAEEIVEMEEAFEEKF